MPAPSLPTTTAGGCVKSIAAMATALGEQSAPAMWRPASLRWRMLSPLVGRTDRSSLMLPEMEEPWP